MTLYEHGGWGRQIPGTFVREWVRNQSLGDGPPLTDEEKAEAIARRLNGASCLLHPVRPMRDPLTQIRVNPGEASSLPYRYVVVAETLDGERVWPDGETFQLRPQAFDLAERAGCPLGRTVRVYDSYSHKFLEAA